MWDHPRSWPNSDDDETFFKQTPADHLKHGLQILFQIQSGI